MKKAILMILTISLIVLSSCTQFNDITANGKGLSKTDSICGNGISEAGETSETCCVDVGCYEGFECKSQIRESNTIHFCKKLDKTETYEYEKFLEYWEDINYEYDKTEDSLVNWGTMISKSKSMIDFIEKLSSKNYNVSLEKEFIKHFNRRIELNKIRYDKFKDFEILSDKKQKETIEEIIALYENEKKELESINNTVRVSLDKEFDYDIEDKIIYTNELISSLSEYKQKIEKGISAEIDITNYDSTCFSYSNEGYINSINLGIKNIGGFAIQNPKIDLFLIDSGNQIAKETDEYFGFNNLEVDEERFENVGSMLGYNSGDSVSCDTYELKINLRSGADPKIIATKTIQVKIS